MDYVKVPEKCLLCVFLSTSSGKPYCPFPGCFKDEGKKESEKKESEEKDR